MKIESTGGPEAENRVRQRLARLYEVELDRAERDFQTIKTPLRDGAEQLPRRRLRLRMAVEAVGILAVAAVLVGGGWLATSPSSGPAVSAGPSAAALGADGIPDQVDGQRVYRIGDKTLWGKLGGSFLLGAYAVDLGRNCEPALGQPSSEIDLLGVCQSIGLEASPASSFADALPLALKGATTLTGWFNGPAVVVRVHTHDAESAGCSTELVAACQAAVVVEAVVWPTVPTEIAGERVYRAVDQSSFAGMKGSFLLGGVFLKPDLVPPCPAPIDKSAAEQQLIPYCYLESIDGLLISPMSSIDEPTNEIVVARVHVNDPLAAECPAAVVAGCRAAIVVESVVWRSDVLVNASPTAGPGGPSSAPAAGSSVNVIAPSSGTGEAPSLPSSNPGSGLIPPPLPSRILPNAS